MLTPVIRSHNRSDGGATYNKLRRAMSELIRKDARAKAAFFEQLKQVADPEPHFMKATVSPSTVHANTFLTNLSIQYANGAYIGTELMPVVPVTKVSDHIATYDKRDRLNTPDPRVAERSIPNEVVEHRDRLTYNLQGLALTSFVDWVTIANQDEVFDELADAAIAPAEDIALWREIQIAGILTTGANFAGNTTNGTDWTNDTTGDPIGDIQAAIAATWSGRGPTEMVGYCSLDVWNALASNAKILARFVNVKGGMATKEQIAGYFGLAAIYVSDARYDTANIGQTASYGRIWGDVFGVVRRMTSPSKRTAAFGSTFRLKGAPWTTTWTEQRPGVNGGYVTKVSTMEDYKILAPDTGYLLTSVLS